MGQIISTVFEDRKLSEKELFPSAIEINDENILKTINLRKGVKIENTN